MAGEPIGEHVGRLFVGVELPDEAKMAVVDRAFDAGPVSGKPVPAENLHLTLRFLGKVDVGRYELLLSKLDGSHRGTEFKVSLGAPGAFPASRRATVLWVGVKSGLERLADLAAVSEAAATDAGFEPEDRPFRAHLTLSRIRPPEDVRPWVEEWDVDPVIRFEVKALTVFRSHLGDGGTRYEPLERFALN